MIELLAAGWGEGWWRVGGDWYVSDGQRLWSPGSPARCWPIAQVRQLVFDPDGLRAVTADGEARLTADGAVRRLPRGAPVRWGELAVWVADGFVYARLPGGTRAIDAIGPRERAWVGGGGAVVVEGPRGIRAGAPGRTPRPVGPGEGIRVSDDGRWFALRTPAGAVRRPLPDGEARALAGWPITDQISWDGALHGAPGPCPVAREGTSARQADRLAGPDGRVWDLATGRPVTDPGTVAAGVTVPMGGGFLSIDGETGRGGFVDDAGPGWAVALPLDPDDVARDGRPDGDEVWVGTALGEGFRVGPGGRVTPAPPPPRLRRRREEVDSPAGRLSVTGTASVGARTWAWNDDGWLWRFAARSD